MGETLLITMCINMYIYMYWVAPPLNNSPKSGFALNAPLNNSTRKPDLVLGPREYIPFHAVVKNPQLSACNPQAHVMFEVTRYV